MAMVRMGCLVPAMIAFALPAASTPINGNMRSFGTAIKESPIAAGEEKTAFEHTLPSGATHGAITQQWHGGFGNFNLRVRIYVDGETTASVDYEVGMAHGAGPNQTHVRGRDDPAGEPPWAAGESFGRTHDSGFWNTYLVPFGRSVRVTVTNPTAIKFWYMVRGVEQAPLVLSGLELPPSARLRLQRTTATVRANSVVTLANVSGTGGLLRQLTLVANSSDYLFQEGCMSARVDGAGLWLSSGLEDYFLAAYFGIMAPMHQPFGGFDLGAVDEPSPSSDPNTVAAYRIHEKDPILFTDSFELYWIASSDAPLHKGTSAWCNGDWPAKDVPTTPSTPDKAGHVSVDAIAWLYVW